MTKSSPSQSAIAASGWRRSLGHFKDSTGILLSARKSEVDYRPAVCALFFRRGGVAHFTCQNSNLPVQTALLQTVLPCYLRRRRA